MNSPARRVALRHLTALALTVLVMTALPAAGQCVSLTTLGAASSQNFDTLSNVAASTTNNLTITGWYMTESGGGARDNEQYAVDTGASNTGDTYSYGAAGSTDRALGSLRSGTLIPIYGACFTNNTGSAITSLDIAYTGEEWRLGTAARTDQLTFEYSTSATSLTTGVWTGVAALNFTTPDTATTGAKNGNAAADRTAISSTIPSLSIPSGATLWIRWNDTDATGADDGLAIDDFSLTPQGSGPVVPVLTIDDVTVTEGNSGTVTAAFTVSLSTPAPVGGVTFDIATADNTATTADNDYVASALTGQTIAAGSTGPYTFNVTVNGDTTVEPMETFFVNVTNVVGANVGDGQGVGTITNDDVPVYEIFAIQGSGAASPYAGQIVTTNNNVVTAVGTQGFFIQTPTARDDGNPDTSNGIYVFTSSVPTVAVGDLVNVTGTVVEYFNFTEFSPVTSVAVVSSNNPLPAAIELDATLPPTDPTAAWWTIGWERLEGMLVHVANGITTAGNQRFSTDLSAEIYAVARPSRAFREPGIKYPGVAGLPVWDGNPEVFEIDPDRLGTVPDPDYVPGGSTYTTTGVMAYEFSGWEIWPTAFSYTPPTFPRPVRVRNAGEFAVGTYNLLQLDASASDYATRLMKHSGYIRTVLGAPDVLGVEECMSITELNALAARIHADDASLNYTAYLQEGHDVGGIDVGFLVKDTVTNAVVTQLGYDAIFAMDGSFLHDRPPLLLEATYAGHGAPFAFTVMVNHTRSLNGIADPVDGNRVRNKRLAQAQWIAQWIQDYQTAPATASRPFAMVGDLNANEITDGYVDVIGQMAGDAVPADNMLSGPNLVTPTLTKQTLSVPANDRYSYTFEGSAEVLDHALTTQPTNTWVRGFAYGRGNSDAAVNLEFDASNILRASDHDGAVLFFMSDANADGIPDDSQSADLSITKLASPDPVLTGGTLTYTLTVSNAGPAASGPATVTDTLPAGVDFVSATGTGWTCVQSTGTVTCNATNLVVGAAPDITIIATVTAASGTLANTATVSATITDPNAANNTATTTTTITPEADLAVTMSASPNATGPGMTFTHSATVTNLGPAGATGVTLTLTLPAGTLAGTITPAGCVPSGATVTCTVGSLAVGAPFSASVDMTAGVSGTYTTTGVVAGADADPVAANNTATATTSVGQIVATPNPVNMRVPVFSLGSMTLNITNDSTIPAGFTLLERPNEYTWARFKVAGPTWNAPVGHATDRTARAVPQHPLPQTGTAPLTLNATHDFSAGLVLPWGIGFNTMADDMWINDIAAAGGDGFNHRFLTDGTSTGDTIDISSWVGSFAADMTYDPFANRVWQVNVGGDNCIHEMDPAAKTSTGNTICPAFPVSQRGLAFDPVTDTFFAGSWNDGAIQHFDRNGDILETVSAGLDVSGLAYNPGSGHLFVLTNADAAADLYVLDVNNAYAVVSSFKLAGMGAFDQAGLEADCAGNLYAVNQTTGDVLVAPSGETGFCSFSTVPWLDETPKSGALAPGATLPVTLDFITAQQWPGYHRASLRVAGTDPFAPVDVPVNYTIAFLDVPVNHWADPFIHALAGVRVTRGCGEGNFCPEGLVDRAQMAILMVRAMHGPLFVPAPATGVFVDVPVSDTDTTADFVEQLYRDGVVAGCAVGGGGERYYCPDKPVSRAEMAVFIAGGIALPPVDPPTGYFSDVHGTTYSWAEPYIEAIFNEGITAGCGDHIFCPAATITRAQLAVWLVGAFGFPYLPPTP